ncbi:MAG: 23S rRNA (adenine(2503)-C(2))-methyltransferase RlmN [Spirochaetota bacterium]
MKTHLSGMLPEEISLKLQLQPAYRSRQLFKCLHSGHMDFSTITELPASLRRELSASASLLTTTLVKAQKDVDGTVKLTIKLEDEYIIETVMLKDERNRRTACLSTQAGCGMGCVFCRTGFIGLKRNLYPYEIVEQFLHIRNHYGAATHIVLMGMGEPLCNLAGVRKAMEILNHPDGAGISYRKITLSTCGIIPGIHELAENGPPVRLAVSLITAQQDVREKLIPAAKSNPLPDLQRALIGFQRITGKRVTIEYVLLDGVNDSIRDIDSLEEFIRPLKTIINLIPWNPVREIRFTEPSTGKVKKFVEELKKRQIQVVQRYRRGRGINGACGQLGGAACIS